MDKIREIKGGDKGGDVYLYKKIERRARSHEEDKVSSPGVRARVEGARMHME